MIGAWKLWHSGARAALTLSAALASVAFASVAFASAAAAGTSTTASAAPASTASTAPESSYGLHGMVLWGGQSGLYASHMPMFHRPHDLQVVMAIHVDDPKVERALRAGFAAKPEMWSIVPEQFELDRLAPGSAHPLNTFRADIVQGHFERGGVTRYSQVRIVVESVLHFQKLDAQPRRSGQGSYRVLTRGENDPDAFVVKLIDARPDVDQIVAFRRKGPQRLPAGFAMPLPSSGPDTLTLAPAQLRAELEGRCQCHLAAGVEIYRETEDLQ